MRHPFLALLATGPAHGYELKQALDERFGSTMPVLNAGQVYTTLARLERDGLVRGHDIPEDSRQKRVYELTAAGREALDDWVATPTPATRLRDEFFAKDMLTPDKIVGLSVIAKDATKSRYIRASMSRRELAELVQVPSSDRSRASAKSGGWFRLLASSRSRLRWAGSGGRAATRRARPPPAWHRSGRSCAAAAARHRTGGRRRRS